MSRFSELTVTRLGAVRARVRRAPGGELVWRVLVILVGAVLTIGGLLLVPLPGPGWLIVFLGLAVLGTEFVWAARLLRFARAKVAATTAYFKAQPFWIRGVVAATTLVVVVALIGGCLALYGWWPFSGHDETAGAWRVA